MGKVEDLTSFVLTGFPHAAPVTGLRYALTGLASTACRNSGNSGSAIDTNGLGGGEFQGERRVELAVDGAEAEGGPLVLVKD